MKGGKCQIISDHVQHMLVFRHGGRRGWINNRIFGVRWYSLVRDEDKSLYLQWDNVKKRYTRNGGGGGMVVESVRGEAKHGGKKIQNIKELYTNLDDETTSHWIRLYDRAVKDRDFEKAWRLLRKMSSLVLTRDLTASAFSALIYETSSDIDLAVGYVDKFVAEFRDDYDSPPARTIAYLLHCACLLDDKEKSRRVIEALVERWRNYGKDLEKVLDHQDILHGWHREVIRSVSYFNNRFVWDWN
jgi:hypothetical protein